MLFSKKNRQKPQKPGQGNHNANSLYPVLYVTEHLKDYKDDLIQKEVDSLFELSLVNNSFSGVFQFPCPHGASPGNCEDCPLLGLHNRFVGGFHRFFKSVGKHRNVQIIAVSHRLGKAAEQLG